MAAIRMDRECGNLTKDRNAAKHESNSVYWDIMDAFLDHMVSILVWNTSDDLPVKSLAKQTL